MNIGVLHGPNLNLLGRREPELYGEETLEEINGRLTARAADLGVELEIVQSNDEGELLDWIQDVGGRLDGLLVNAAAYTHTSLAIRDALIAAGLPFIEVHLTNVFAREPYRRHSYLSDVAAGIVSGFGGDSYLLALEGLCARVRGT